MSTKTITAKVPTPVHAMFELEKKRYKMTTDQLIVELIEESYGSKKKWWTGTIRASPKQQSASAPAPQNDDSNLIHVGGKYMGRPDYSESLDPLVDVMNRMYTVPDWKLMDDTQSSFYIFRTDNQQVLARGVAGFDNSKQRVSYLRKRHGLKFDQVRFKK